MGSRVAHAKNQSHNPRMFLLVQVLFRWPGFGFRVYGLSPVLNERYKLVPSEMAVLFVPGYCQGFQACTPRVVPLGFRILSGTLEDCIGSYLQGYIMTILAKHFRGTTLGVQPWSP